MMNDRLTKGDAMEQILRNQYRIHRNGEQTFQVVKHLKDGRWMVRMYEWEGVTKQLLTDEEIHRDYRPCTWAEASSVLN